MGVGVCVGGWGGGGGLHRALINMKHLPSAISPMRSAAYCIVQLSDWSDFAPSRRLHKDVLMVHDGRRPQWSVWSPTDHHWPPLTPITPPLFRPHRPQQTTCCYRKSPLAGDLWPAESARRPFPTRSVSIISIYHRYKLTRHAYRLTPEVRQPWPLTPRSPVGAESSAPCLWSPRHLQGKDQKALLLLKYINILRSRGALGGSVAAHSGAAYQILRPAGRVRVGQGQSSRTSVLD